jgi:hypothetical protein
MVSSRASKVALFLAVVVVGLGSERARAAPDAAAEDGERYAQRVASAVRSHHGEVKACYAVALERNPQLNGKFDAVWTIDTAGKPHSVHFALPPADAEFAACMVRTIAAWRFEKPTEPSEVMFPFVFHAGAAGLDQAAPPAPPATPPVAQTPTADQRPSKSSAKETTRQRKRAPTTTTTTPPSGLNEARQRPKR